MLRAGSPGAVPSCAVDGPSCSSPTTSGPPTWPTSRVGRPVPALALARGAATSHAAIMARSLGLPMVVGAGRARSCSRRRRRRSSSTVTPARRTSTRAEARWAPRRDRPQPREQARRCAERAPPAVTRDGRRGPPARQRRDAGRGRAGLEAGADGVGLLRTELAFLDGDAWPTEDEHVAQLAPLLALLDGLVATVRVLDFGGDKTPPFLAGIRAARPRAAARASGRARRPAARDPARRRGDRPAHPAPARRVAAAGSGRARAAAECRSRSRLDAQPPPLGAMIETPRGRVLARTRSQLEADFLSIGTNDLVQYTLGLDRSSRSRRLARAADPRVLSLIARDRRRGARARAHGRGLRRGGVGSGRRCRSRRARRGRAQRRAGPADELRRTVRRSPRGLGRAEARRRGGGVASVARSQASSGTSGRGARRPRRRRRLRRR